MLRILKTLKTNFVDPLVSEFLQKPYKREGNKVMLETEDMQRT